MRLCVGGIMPRKKKEVAPEEPQEAHNQPEELMMVAAGASPVELRLQLLGLSKEILEHQSHLSWETHKQVVDVTIEDVIDGARELLEFVTGSE